MLHREIGARPDAGVRLRGVVHDALRSANPALTPPPQAQARGPLGQAVLRLLGIGGARQGWQGASERQLSAMFNDGAGPPWGARGVSQAWLGARALPTPNGAYRAVVVPA